MRLLGLVFFTALAWVLLATAIIGFGIIASFIGWGGTLAAFAFFGLFVAICHGILTEEPEIRFVSDELYDWMDEL